MEARVSLLLFVRIKINNFFSIFHFVLLILSKEQTRRHCNSIFVSDFTPSKIMKLEHVAIYTHQLERLKNFYIRYFEGEVSEKYEDKQKKLNSYFISFENGARIELMQREGIPENKNDTVFQQHRGIIHIAFQLSTMQQVKEKAEKIKADGYPILSGPRKTGDGYYKFETLDPDNNRLEVIATFHEE